MYNIFRLEGSCLGPVQGEKGNATGLSEAAGVMA